MHPKSIKTGCGPIFIILVNLGRVKDGASRSLSQVFSFWKTEDVSTVCSDLADLAEASTRLVCPGWLYLMAIEKLATGLWQLQNLLVVAPMLIRWYEERPAALLVILQVDFRYFRCRVTYLR